MGDLIEALAVFGVVFAVYSTGYFLARMCIAYRAEKRRVEGRRH